MPTHFNSNGKMVSRCDHHNWYQSMPQLVPYTRLAVENGFCQTTMGTAASFKLVTPLHIAE
jgi:hypothetical protein